MEFWPIFDSFLRLWPYLCSKRETLGFYKQAIHRRPGDEPFFYFTILVHPTRRQSFANTVLPHWTQDLTPRHIVKHHFLSFWVCCALGTFRSYGFHNIHTFFHNNAGCIPSALPADTEKNPKHQWASAASAFERWQNEESRGTLTLLVEFNRESESNVF